MNLNIEGTKHEKAVLVILSYVSGFTAGFIIFGMSSMNTDGPEQIIYQVPVQNEVSMNTESGVDTPTPETTELADEVLYKDGRLMANVNGASVLLSAQLATVDSETAKSFAAQGVHEAIPKYLASESGDYIYYCEQHSTADSCTNFIYDVNNQVIQYVTVDGKKLTSNAQTAKTATWNNGTLTIDNSASVATDTPWKLVKTQ